MALDSVKNWLGNAGRAYSPNPDALKRVKENPFVMGQLLPQQQQAVEESDSESDLIAQNETLPPFTRQDIFEGLLTEDR